MTLAISVAAGCTGKGTHETDLTDAITRGATEGPVQVSLTAGPQKLALSDHLTVRIDVTVDSGVTIADVPYEAALREGDRRFELRLIRATHEKPQPVDENNVRWRHEYEIEFVLPGEHELPGAEVTFVPLPDANSTETAEPVESQTVSTTPFSVVAGDAAAVPVDPAELAKIERLDPIELPAVWRRWWWAIPAGLMVLILTVALLNRRKQRVETEAIAFIPAHEWARREFATLITDDLISRGRIQEFYYRVSGIVRGYIERRFSVAAPEMTTEEFLTTAVSDRRFDDNTTQELDRFLVACDLVKYARHEPGEVESQGMLSAATDFVERTRVRAIENHDDEPPTPQARSTESAA